MCKIKNKFLFFLILIFFLFCLGAIGVWLKSSDKKICAISQDNQLFEMEAGASFRSYWTLPNCGITFGAKMNEDNENANNVKLFLAPYDYVTSVRENTKEPLDYVNVFNSVGKEYLSIAPKIVNQNGVVYFRAGIKNVKYGNLNRKFFGIFYYQNGVDNNNKPIYVYADIPYGEENQARSMAYVSSCFASTEATSINDIEKTNYYVEKSIDNAVYKANKETGNLETISTINLKNLSLTLDRITYLDDKYGYELKYETLDITNYADLYVKWDTSNIENLEIQDKTIIKSQVVENASANISVGSKTFDVLVNVDPVAYSKDNLTLLDDLFTDDVAVNGQAIKVFFPASGNRLTDKSLIFNVSKENITDNNDGTAEIITENGNIDGLISKVFEITYKIIYNTSGGNIGGQKTITYKKSTPTFSLPTSVELYGYGFISWHENSDLSDSAISSIKEGSFGDKTFYANYQDLRKAMVGNSVSNYNTLYKDKLNVYGDFYAVKITSLTQLDKNYDAGSLDSSWDFSHNDTTVNYADYAKVVDGENGSGYISLDSTLLERLWGETTFIATFSNGDTQQFTVSSNNVLFTNYDDTTIDGYYGGVRDAGPLHSGMYNNVATIEDGINGKAIFVRTTQGAEDCCLFTVKLHEHPWRWYAVEGKADNLYRVTFDYQISKNLAQDSVYFYVMSPSGEDINSNFFGNYSQLDWVAGDNYYKVRYNLIADGNVHTFDSGYFTFNSTLRLMKIQLPSFTSENNAFVMVDNYKLTQIPTLESKAQLSEETKNILNGEAHVKLAGDFDPTLSIKSITRQVIGETNTSLYAYDNSFANAVNLDVNYAKVERDGLIISSAMINQAYKTQQYVITFNNGITQSFTLQSNLNYYSNFDETSVFSTEQGNRPTCQDTAMWQIIETNGNKLVSYNPSLAKQTHAINAINGNGTDNKIFTFSNARTTVAGNGIGYWYQMDFGTGTTVVVSFDFNIILGYDETLKKAKENHFKFSWIDVNNVETLISLVEGERFYIEIPSDSLLGFGICCSVSSPSLVEGSCLYVDNFSVGVKNMDTILIEHHKNVKYGGGSVTLSGNFDDGVSVEVLSRTGLGFWDDSKDGAISINTSYLSITSEALVISSELVNQIYGTEYFVVRLSNGQVVTFSLTSNLIFYSNYDETNVFATLTGNNRACQDAKMWEVVNVDGNNKVKYTPYNAEQTHAVNAINGVGTGNMIYTFGNEAICPYDFWKFDFGNNQKVIVSFDYEFVGDKNSLYQFVWVDAKGVNYTTNLIGVGTFVIELDVANLSYIGINCPASSKDLVDKTHLYIDDFLIGIL